MKKESIKLAGILCIITLVAALLLAFVNQLTAPEIIKAEKAASENAMKKILADAQSFESIEENIFAGMNGDNLVGYCVSVAPKGFGGEISMMVGISSQGTVTGIEILGHGETPGLGAKAANDDFKNSFKGKNPYLDVVKVPTESIDEVTAITGATITSNAVASGVAQAFDMLKDIKGGNK